MNFKTPTVNGTELAEGQHQSLTAELAEVRVLLGLSDSFEPVQELQFGDNGQLKRQTEDVASVLEFRAAGTIVQTEMPNADKALGQDMREEAADKLVGG